MTDEVVTSATLREAAGLVPTIPMERLVDQLMDACLEAARLGHTELWLTVPDLVFVKQMCFELVRRVPPPNVWAADVGGSIRMCVFWSDTHLGPGDPMQPRQQVSGSGLLLQMMPQTQLPRPTHRLETDGVYRIL